MGPMDRTVLRQLLADVQAGTLDPDVAAGRLATALPGIGPVGSEDAETPIARIDHHRALRHGFPEVVLGSSKTVEDLVRIATEVLARHDTLLVTRATVEQAQALEALFPEAEWHSRARAVTVERRAAGTPPTLGKEGVLLVTAGTGDIPVAEEARVTLKLMGHAPDLVYDVGVAGLNRILSEVDRLRSARVIVVCAGMDGALPSVVGGLVGVPVIAVPTSVGYGMQLDGIAPLLTMLNACAPNVSVVNVDNGFGAGYLAALINRLS